jgi:hypothetical protein
MSKKKSTYSIPTAYNYLHRILTTTGAASTCNFQIILHRRAHTGIALWKIKQYPVQNTTAAVLHKLRCLDLIYKKQNLVLTQGGKRMSRNSLCFLNVLEHALRMHFQNSLKTILLHALPWNLPRYPFSSEQHDKIFRTLPCGAQPSKAGLCPSLGKSVREQMCDSG